MPYIIHQIWLPDSDLVFTLEDIRFPEDYQREIEKHLWYEDEN